MNKRDIFVSAMLLPFTVAAAGAAPRALAGEPSEPWLKQYEPNAQSRKFPAGSAAERRARMHAVAYSRAYTHQFDLQSLPSYVPRFHPSGTLRICGNNYLGDSPLGNWLKAAFAQYQPGIKIVYHLQTAANGFACLYEDRADIGIDHQPLFYDDLSNMRLKGFLPTGFSVLTGSYDVIGWQNAFAVIVNAGNPVSGVTLRQLDDIFGSQRAGGWDRMKWEPKYARGPEQNIRRWGQMGLGGVWAERPVDTYGFSLRYSTALEFSDDVLKSSDKWNGNLLAFGNYKRPDGTTYLESDQIIDHVAHDPGGIGYIRFHQDLPKTVKVLKVAETSSGPYVPLTLETEQSRSYPLWGQQQFWVEAKPGTRLDPKIYEFIRFVLSRQGQALVERDGKYLPITASVAKGELKRLDEVEAGRRVKQDIR
jgi:phosphate transport system substrate-binding protein